MRRHSLTRTFVITLTILFAIAAAAAAQETGTDQPKKKSDPATQTAPAAAQESGKAQAKKKKPHMTTDTATETAPATSSQPASQTGKSGDATGKGKAPADPKEAGWLTVHGRIITVQADHNTLIIQTDAKQYQVHVNAQTQILRDGQAAELKALKMNDRVDSCHFNAKHVAQSLKVTSAENVLAHPNTPKQ